MNKTTAQNQRSRGSSFKKNLENKMHNTRLGKWAVSGRKRGGRIGRKNVVVFPQKSMVVRSLCLFSSFPLYTISFGDQTD